MIFDKLNLQPDDRVQIEYRHRPVEIEVLWRFRESGLIVAETHNLLTSFGLTALAAAPSGNYIAPIYMLIDTANTTMQQGNNPGDTLVTLNADPTIAGDSQLVLSLGQAAQETVTFNSKGGTGPFTFTLSSGCVNTHNPGDFAGRAPTSADTLASVLAEGQYDPTYFANQRVTMTAQYSPGVGQSTMQFFIAGIQASNMFMAHVGLADTVTLGTGNLHNYAALGYNHNSGNDLEIDVTYTLTAT